MVISEITHGALVIMGELAKEYGCRGITSSQISQLNDIPQNIIDIASAQLIDLGFVDFYKDVSSRKGWTSDAPLFLTKHPDEIYIADILTSIDRNKFNGIFKDSNGSPLPQSRLTLRLNQLRHRTEAAVISSMFGLTVDVLATWSKLEIGVTVLQ